MEIEIEKKVGKEKKNSVCERKSEFVCVFECVCVCVCERERKKVDLISEI